MGSLFGIEAASVYADRVLVITSDGRCYVGVLRACDQATNLVLDQTTERVFSTEVCFFGQYLCTWVCDLLTTAITTSIKLWGMIESL
jgi:hypothetical protein